MTHIQYHYYVVYRELLDRKDAGRDVEGDTTSDMLRIELYATWDQLTAKEREPFLSPPRAAGRGTPPVNHDYSGVYTDRDRERNRRKKRKKLGHLS